jgi:hypothetical protein
MNQPSFSTPSIWEFLERDRLRATPSVWHVAFQGAIPVFDHLEADSLRSLRAEVFEQVSQTIPIGDV